MKKQILSLALALALSIGLSVSALADFETGGNAASMSTARDPVGQSLSAPEPLPAHLGEYTGDEAWLVYDFDHADLLEVSKDEWDDQTYVMLEGSTFTIYPNPNWNGTIHWADVNVGEDENICLYAAPEEYSGETPKETWRYMPPLTLTFTHDMVAADGMVIDMADPTKEYDIQFQVFSAQGEEHMITWLGQSFRVIPAIAYATTQTVTIDGKAVEFQMYAIKDANGNDTNYVKVRDVALALDGTAAQFNVGYNGGVDLETGKPYTTRNGQENNTPYSGNQPFKAATSYTYVNGDVADLTAFVITDQSGNGSTYYKLRDLGETLGFSVDWSGKGRVY